MQTCYLWSRECRDESVVLLSWSTHAFFPQVGPSPSTCKVPFFSSSLLRYLVFHCFFTFHSSSPPLVSFESGDILCLNKLLHLLYSCLMLPQPFSVHPHDGQSTPHAYELFQMFTIASSQPNAP